MEEASIDDFDVIVDPAAAEWETFVDCHPYGHLLQTAAWGDFKAKWGWHPRRVVVRGHEGVMAGAQVLSRRLPLGRSVAYVPRGPVAVPGDADALGALWKAIHPVARTSGAVFLTVEPNWPEPVDVAGLWRAGFRPAVQHIQPRATITLDLRPSLDEILAQMKSKWRYNIRLAERKQVIVRVGGIDDFALYHDLMRATGTRDEFGIRPAGYYRDAWAAFQPGRSRLFIAEHAGEPLAALIAFRTGATASYLYGASSDRERNRMPNHALQWAAIQWAKAAGCERYDLWGIPPEVPAARELAEEEYGTGGLWGVYRFKQGFGGRVVTYPGAFDFVYSRPLYWAYQQLIARRGVGE